MGLNSQWGAWRTSLGEGRARVYLAPELSTPGVNQASSFSSCVILINSQNMVCVWGGRVQRETDTERELTEIVLVWMPVPQPAPH